MPEEFSRLNGNGVNDSEVLVSDVKSESVPTPTSIPDPSKSNKKTKNRYSDEELGEFKELLQRRLETAQEDFEMYSNSVTYKDSNGDSDTSPTFKVLEEGAVTLSKEESGKLAQRQLKFISHLKAGMVRIENKTYGICLGCQKEGIHHLIEKGRLRAVPHATKCMDIKNQN